VNGLYAVPEFVHYRFPALSNAVLIYPHRLTGTNVQLNTSTFQTELASGPVYEVPDTDQTKSRTNSRNNLYELMLHDSLVNAAKQLPDPHSLSGNLYLQVACTP